MGEENRPKQIPFTGPELFETPPVGNRRINSILGDPLHALLIAGGVLAGAAFLLLASVCWAWMTEVLNPQIWAWWKSLAIGG